MTLMDQLTAEFKKTTENLVPDEYQGNTWSLSANAISTFGVNLTDDKNKVVQATGGIETGDIKLVEVSVRDQRRAAQHKDDPRIHWFRTAEFLFCAPGARVGLMEVNPETKQLEFVPLPQYNSDNPLFAQIVNDVPYISAQLMRCNYKVTGLGEGEEGDTLYAYLRDNGFHPVDIPSANRLWTLSVPPISDAGSRNFRRNLRARTDNSEVAISSLAITPSTDPTRGGFRDFVNPQIEMVRRVVLGNRPNATDKDRKLAGQLLTCLTGAQVDNRVEDGSKLQPVRVSVGVFNTHVPVKGGYEDREFNIWPGEDEDITDEERPDTAL